MPPVNKLVMDICHDIHDYHKRKSILTADGKEKLISKIQAQYAHLEQNYKPKDPNISVLKMIDFKLGNSNLTKLLKTEILENNGYRKKKTNQSRF